MLEVLVVCTGNVCRSPLAEALLRTRIGSDLVAVSSRGTRALRDQPATPETRRLAESYGVPADDIDAHVARQLREGDLASPHLVLAMSREHRREIVELNPARTRTTFLVRELAGLAEHLSDDELRAVADRAGRGPQARLAGILTRVSAVRGELAQPRTPDEDDVVDPFHRSWETYQRAGTQLEPAIAQAERLLRLALGARLRPPGA